MTSDEEEVDVRFDDDSLEDVLESTLLVNQLLRDTDRDRESESVFRPMGTAPRSQSRHMAQFEAPVTTVPLARAPPSRTPSPSSSSSAIARFRRRRRPAAVASPPRYSYPVDQVLPMPTIDESALADSDDSSSSSTSSDSLYGEELVLATTTDVLPVPPPHAAPSASSSLTPAITTPVNLNLQAQMQVAVLGMYTRGRNGAPPRPPSTAPPPLPSLFQELDRSLGARFERVLHHHLDHTPPAPDRECTQQQEKFACAFEREHGVTPARFQDMLKAVAGNVVASYRTLFEVEQRVFGAATRYDRVSNWLRCSDQEFDNDALREQLGHVAQQAADQMSGEEALGNDMRALQEAIHATRFQHRLACDMHRVLGGEKQCKICFGATADTVLMPCGHAMCQSCAKRVSCCPYCNLSFCSQQRVYYM